MSPSNLSIKNLIANCFNLLSVNLIFKYGLCKDFLVEIRTLTMTWFFSLLFAFGKDLSEGYIEYLSIRDY